MKLKQATPLMAILAILAVCATVGATVVLTSNTITYPGTHVVNNQGAIVLTLGTQPTGTFYSTDDAGVVYPMTGVIPQDLSGAVATITIVNEHANSAWSDIGSVKIKAYGETFAAVPYSANGQTLVYTVAFTDPVPDGTLSGNVVVVFNIPGDFDVSASLTGTYVH
jgi:hypothetical protein